MEHGQISVALTYPLPALYPGLVLYDYFSKEQAPCPTTVTKPLANVFQTRVMLVSENLVFHFQCYPLRRTLEVC